MTIKQAINIASKKIGYINSKVLMKYILGKDDTYIVSNQNEELDENLENKYFKLTEKVQNGYPLQYITNKQEFMGLNFYVDENVLIPQPDTEISVQKVIEFAKSKKEPKILDLCTGSGVIAITIKKYLPNAVIVGSDISKKAIEVAKKNAEENEVDIDLVQSDMFENISGTFDVIVSNPPYIKSEVIKSLPKDVQKEPYIALDGGVDGLKFYKIIAQNVKKYLKEDGILILEIGYDQKDEVTRLFKNSVCFKDYEGRDRVVVWNHSQEK